MKTAPVTVANRPPTTAKCEYCGRYGRTGNCDGCGAPTRPIERIEITTFGDAAPVFVERWQQ